MPPLRFTVTEVRLAASCPRIFYFDRHHARTKGTGASTRLWKGDSAETTACGPLFHATIERMNRRAAADPAAAALLEVRPDRDALYRGWRTYLNDHCVDYPAFIAKPAAQKRAFVAAIDRYIGELADILADALARGRPPRDLLEALFGDRRRKLDVTFEVGQPPTPVQVVGELDYVFHDWRTGGHRILDYKLAPAHQPSNDLFQVALYALMHERQHGTRASVGVLYLHPDRRMVEMSWEQVESERPKVLALLDSMAGWLSFDEASGRGLKPPGEPMRCASCRWDRDGQCARRLGPKTEGARAAVPAEPERSPAAPAAPFALKAKPAPARPGSLFPRPLRGREAPAEPGTEPRPLEFTAPRPEAASSVAQAETDRPKSTEAPTKSSSSPADHLLLGATRTGVPVSPPLDTLKTHTAIVGAAGSGKTWLAKVLVEEAVAQGVPVLAIDPQGDLVQFLRSGPIPPGATAEHTARRRVFLDRVDARVWTPGSTHARPLHFAPLGFPERPAWSALDEADRDGYLALVAGQLADLAGVRARVQVHQTFLMALLRELLAGDLLVTPDLPALLDAIRTPDRLGPRWDPSQFLAKSDQTKLVHALNSLIHGPARSLFTGGAPFDLDEMCRPSAPGRTPLNVLYLNALAGDVLKAQVVAKVATEVYRWMVGRGADPTGRPRLLVYLDEARDFLPAGTTKPAAKEPLIRLFSQGRKYGVCGLICTQSPRSVDYNVFSNCSAKLIGRLESAQDVARVAQWFAVGGSPPWLAARVKSGAGEFVGRWPDMPPTLEGSTFHVRPLYSLHEGAWSPERVQDETRGAAPGPRGSPRPDGPPLPST